MSDVVGCEHPEDQVEVVKDWHREVDPTKSSDEDNPVYLNGEYQTTRCNICGSMGSVSRAVDQGDSNV